MWGELWNFFFSLTEKAAVLEPQIFSGGFHDLAQKKIHPKMSDAELVSVYTADGLKSMKKFFMVSCFDLLSLNIHSLNT